MGYILYLYRKADPQQAISCLGKAIEIYTDMGRFTIAAKHHITIAEICELDTADIEMVSYDTLTVQSQSAHSKYTHLAHCYTYIQYTYIYYCYLLY